MVGRHSDKHMCERRPFRARRWLEPPAALMAGRPIPLSLGLILCLALACLAIPATASAAAAASGLRMASPTSTSVVEPAQHRRRGLVGKRKRKRLLRHRRERAAKGFRRLPGGRLHRPRRDEPAHDRPRRPGHADQPRPPKRIKPVRLRLRLPPIFILPDVPPEQARVLRSLPRRMQQPPRARPPAQRIERQILVLVDQTRPPALGAQLAQAYGLQLLSSRPITLLGARAELFRVPTGRSETAALAALQRDARVRSAQFNMRYLHSSDREAGAIPQYGPRKVQLPDAHRLALGRNVAIAVIDSQVDTAHPDLDGAQVRTFDAVGDADATPDFHGTAVAGIIGSRGVVEGVAPRASILAVRAFRTRQGALPETSTEILLGAIEWAAANGAKVLNMSFVGPRDGALQEMLDAARRRGITLVAAAGNGGPKAPPAYPAAYAGVIAVTAVDAADRRYRHANRGRYIAVAAPGVDVLAPVNDGEHELLSGTSFATAYVSGIAALLLERNPNLGAAAVAQLVAATADDLGPAGRDEDFGAGRVNALAALESMREIATR